jgi:hypothetical protein
VIAGIDGSVSAVHAAIWAGAEASRRRLPLRLVYVYAVPPHTGFPDIVGSLEQVRDAMAEQGRDRLAEARAAVLTEIPGLTMEIAARMESCGGAYPGVGAYADDCPRLPGPGRIHRIAHRIDRGSLAAHGHCPIAVVRGRTPGDPPPTTGPVIVGVDGSPGSDAALAFACEEAAL